MVLCGDCGLGAAHMLQKEEYEVDHSEWPIELPQVSDSYTGTLRVLAENDALGPLPSK